MTFLRDRLLRAQIKDGLYYWVYIPAAVIFGGMTVDLLFELPVMPKHWAFSLVSLILVISGAGLIQKATKDLSSYGEGTPNPLRPPKRLVIEGSYSLCRHPMFFGYDLAALGVVLLFRSWGMLLFAYPVFIAMEYRFLRGEERKLEKRFGAQFAAYRRHVPLLLPHGRGRGKVS